MTQLRGLLSTIILVSLSGCGGSDEGPETLTRDIGNLSASTETTETVSAEPEATAAASADNTTLETGTPETTTTEASSTDTATTNTNTTNTDTVDVAMTETTGTGTTDPGTADTGTTDTNTNETGTSDTGATGTDTTDTGNTSTEVPVASKSFKQLCEQPGVILCDDFESGADNWSMEGDAQFVAGAAVKGEGNTIVELRTYENRQSAKIFTTFANRDEVYVRYDVKYAKDYDNSGGSHGPVLGGSMSPPYGIFGKAGIQPDGTNHFIVNHEPLRSDSPIGEYGFYSYFANMKPDGRGDYWGNVFRSEQTPAPSIVADQWQCVEFSIKLNNSNAVDGTMSFWLDDVFHGSFGGIQYRTTDSLGINTLIIDSYNHFRNGAVPQSTPNRVYYDNVVISTDAIGCL